MNIIKFRNYFITFSGILTLIAILLWIMWGLNLGIDFTGGSLLEIEYPQNRPVVSDLNSKLADLNLKGLKIQEIGDKGYILRFQETGEEVHQKVLAKLNNQEIENPVENSNLNIESTSGTADIEVSTSDVSTNENKVIEKRFDSIGPSIGAELKTKAFYAVFWVVICIVIYIAIAFRKVSSH